MKIKSVYAMVGLEPLPGTYNHRGKCIRDIAFAAVAEAIKLEKAGFCGLIIQNINDFPGMKKVNPEITAYMSVIGNEIRAAVSPQMRLGVSVLWNDGEAAVAVADAIQADFVRLKVFIGAMVNAEGIVQGCSGEVLQIKKRLGSRVELWADILDRTGFPLGVVSQEEAIVQAIKRGGADAVILTGKEPERTCEMLAAGKKKFGDLRIFAGGGCTPGNLMEILNYADGAIVASSFKKDGNMYNAIDEKRLKEFSAALKEVPDIYSGNMCRK